MVKLLYLDPDRKLTYSAVNDYKKRVFYFRIPLVPLLGMVQGVKSWGCTVVLRSNKGKISEDFLVPSPKKLGVHVHPVYPLFRHPCDLCPQIFQCCFEI